MIIIYLKTQWRCKIYYRIELYHTFNVCCTWHKIYQSIINLSVQADCVVTIFRNMMQDKILEIINVTIWIFNTRSICICFLYLKNKYNKNYSALTREDIYISSKYKIIIELFNFFPDPYNHYWINCFVAAKKFVPLLKYIFSCSKECYYVWAINSDFKFHGNNDYQFKCNYSLNKQN